MIYEFEAMGCPNAKAPKGKVAVCRHQINLPISKMVPIGQTMACPVEGCNQRVKRVVSRDINVVVRGPAAEVALDEGRAMHTRVNGRDVKFEFIDHKHTDPQYQRKMQALARKIGHGAERSIGKAYISERTGKPVVDVLSNVPDPLGQIERAKRKGDVDITTTKVNQPFRRRGPRKAK